jgi:uncharacterized protein YaaQ
MDAPQYVTPEKRYAPRRRQNNFQDSIRSAQKFCRRAAFLNRILCFLSRLRFIRTKKCCKLATLRGDTTLLFSIHDDEMKIVLTIFGESHNMRLSTLVTRRSIMAAKKKVAKKKPAKKTAKKKK